MIDAEIELETVLRETSFTGENTGIVYENMYV